MRVLLATGIYPPESGGPATFVPALAADWKKRGWDVTVVTYGDERTIRSKDWSVEIVSRAGGALVRYIRYVLRVYTLAKKFDVVFLQGPFSEGLPGSIGAWLAHRPTALRVPGDFAWEAMQRSSSSILSLEEFLHSKKTLKWNLIFWLESLVARRASMVVTPSRYLQQLAEAWGVKEKKRMVVYNTIEVPRELPERQTLRESFQFQQEDKVLLCIARAVPWKRVDFLLEVLTKLDKNYRLVVLDEGRELARWKQKAIELGIAERVRFEGRVAYSLVWHWIKASDAFLLPSLYEGFPHVALEAASLGLPCFLSDKGGNPEAVQTYPNRIRILPYGNLEVWVDVLKTLPERSEPIDPRPFSEVADEYAQVVTRVAKISRQSSTL